MGILNTVLHPSATGGKDRIGLPTRRLNQLSRH
jgi:hypothetical protein